MLRSFDVYLNRRVTECDLFISGLPYRDSLSVYDRLIIESVLQSYLLQKFIAVQTGSILTAHIDDMIKRCYELLSVGVELGAEAAATLRYPNRPEANVVELSAQDVSLLAKNFTDARDAVLIAASPLLVSVSRSFGEANSGIVMSAAAIVSQQNFIRTESGIVLDALDVETEKKSAFAAESGVVLDANILDLCRRVYDVAASAIGISQIVLGTELHYPLGYGVSTVNIGSRVTGLSAQKFVAAASALSIIAEATETLLRYIEPESGVVLGAAASTVLRRYRLLNDVDDITLDDIDDMTLDELYYVTLT